MKISQYDKLLRSNSRYFTRTDKYQNGISAMHPADAVTEHHPSVVFVEKFESVSIEEVLKNWTWSWGTVDHRVSLVLLPRP